MTLPAIAIDSIPTLINSGTRKPLNKIKTYKTPAKNARALIQVSAWLKAVGIEVKPSEAPGCDLAVTHKAGNQVDVAVVTSYDHVPLFGDGLVVLANELTSQHTATAHRAFHMITVAAGYGTPNPVAGRGAEPSRKLRYDDNFELVSMRHREFRRVPNPEAKDITAYNKVVYKAIKRFMGINAVICRRNGVEFEDLRSYARVWTCNYLGLFKVANPTENDNERKLYAYLNQRFTEMAGMLVKKERNCVPDLQAAHIARFGTTFEAINRKQGLGTYLETSAEMSFEDHAEALLDEEVAEEIEVAAFQDGYEGLMIPEVDAQEKEKKISDNKRRKLAAAALKTKLASMPHEDLLALLGSTSTNAYVHPDARKEAVRQLRLHKEDCSVCAAKVQEELARVHAGSL